MSTTTLSAPIRVNTAASTRAPASAASSPSSCARCRHPAGFWLQVAMVALTVVVVVVRLLVGDAADHTFQSVLNAGLQPSAVLLPVSASCSSPPSGPSAPG
jgi:hypothetical protein